MPAAWVFVRSLDGIVSSNTGGGVMSLMRVLCCQADISMLGRSLVQSSPTDFGISSEINLEKPTMRRPRPTGALEPWKI